MKYILPGIDRNTLFITLTECLVCACMGQICDDSSPGISVLLGMNMMYHMIT